MKALLASAAACDAIEMPAAASDVTLYHEREGIINCDKLQRGTSERDPSIRRPEMEDWRSPSLDYLHRGGKERGREGGSRRPNRKERSGTVMQNFFSPTTFPPCLIGRDLQIYKVFCFPLFPCSQSERLRRTYPRMNKEKLSEAAAAPQQHGRSFGRNGSPIKAQSV